MATGREVSLALLVVVLLLGSLNLNSCRVLRPDGASDNAQSATPQYSALLGGRYLLNTRGAQNSDPVKRVIARADQAPGRVKPDSDDTGYGMGAKLSGFWGGR